MKNASIEIADTSFYHDKRQDNTNWLQMWRNEQSGDFHQTHVNTLLTRYWHGLRLKKHSRVLVPLCGKSLDMIWLANQGHQVIGVELSPIAVKAFFQENQLKPKKMRYGNFTCWQSGSISIWCGDIFSLRARQLGRIDCVFDRAGLTALPATIRNQYVEQLRTLMSDDASIFLLTVEEIAKSSKLEIKHIDSELSMLYRKFFNIELTHVQRVQTTLSSYDDSYYFTDHKVYCINQKQETEDEIMK